MNPPENEADTSLPLFHTWGAVYWFVVIVFCGWVTALALLPWLCS